MWRNLFIPANQSRVYEDELKDCFNYEFFNQFEYDFGLTFDEDFREANVLDQETVDLEVLFDGFSDSDSFIKKIETLNFDVKEGYNTAVVLYNFKYEGDVCEVRHNDLYLCFLGYLKYSSQ